jgi:transcriptional regulator with XRE-family HTH domain
MTFGNLIRVERERLHLTQAELAIMLLVSKQTVSNWECGRSTPWSGDQERHLRACRVDVPKATAETIIDRIIHEATP